jgi:uncharacterized protein (DUF1501 family)
MKRREFIKNTGTASLGIPLTLNGLTLSAIPQLPMISAADAVSDRVLVIVQLLGGNDGLNTVVPIKQYANLQKARPHVILPYNKLLYVAPTIAFHPAMTGLRSLYTAGNLGIVQSVGYPDQNRSHFRSIDIWRTGSGSNEILNSGWAGRYFDTLYPGFPIGFPSATAPNPIAIAMGSFVSETCQGRIANYSLALNDPLNFTQVYTGSANTLPAGNYGLELGFMRDAIKDSNAYASGISTAAKIGKNRVSYPNTDIARQLKNVALMISGGMKTKIYVVTQDFFDTHAHQVQAGNTTLGTHANLLKNISDAILAFQNDLKAQGLQKRVIGVSLSEFGRQIKSNASFGTDHGSAAPLFLFGACVKPQILGNSPVIPAVVPDQEGVAMQYDFRNVYGSLLQDWFGADISIVKSILHTGFQHLDLIAADCKIAPPVTNKVSPPVMEEEGITAIGLKVYPNPTSSFSIVEFTIREEDFVQVSIMNAGGDQLKIVTKKIMPKGPQQLSIDLSGYPAGYYFIRIVSGNNKVQTKAIVKM